VDQQLQDFVALDFSAFSTQLVVLSCNQMDRVLSLASENVLQFLQHAQEVEYVTEIQQMQNVFVVVMEVIHFKFNFKAGIVTNVI
jgi:hypothetical protein